jgi:outer membrane receptor protein involved in Fe transport
VERLSPDFNQAAVGIPGYIDVVHDRYTNAAAQRVRGCDVELDTHRPTDSWGAFGGQLIASRIFSNELKILPSLPSEELAGTFGFPEWRANINLYWQKGRWRAGIQGRYTDGYTDGWDTSRNVESHTEWDAQLGVAATRRVAVTVGVENVFDHAPPSGFNQQGFAQQFYDMRGRFFYASVSFETAPLGVRRSSGR